MKLKQLHQNTWVSLQGEEHLLRVKARTLFKSRVIEVAYKDILIRDRYELPYHNKYCLGTSAFFFVLCLDFAKEPFFNPGSSWRLPVVFGVLTLIEVTRLMIPRRRILIPTKDQGLIRL